MICWRKKGAERADDPAALISVIELIRGALVTIAIIGILAAVALPAYQEYSNRAAFSELVAPVTPLQAAVEQALGSGDVASLEQLDGGAYGIPENVQPSATTNGSIVEDGVITMTWRQDGSELAGTTYVLYLDFNGDSLQWFESGSCLELGFC